MKSIDSQRYVIEVTDFFGTKRGTVKHTKEHAERLCSKKHAGATWRAVPV